MILSPKQQEDIKQAELNRINAELVKTYKFYESNGRPEFFKTKIEKLLKKANDLDPDRAKKIAEAHAEWIEMYGDDTTWNEESMELAEQAEQDMIDR